MAGVSIRVDAAGVSIVISDGEIAILERGTATAGGAAHDLPHHRSRRPGVGQRTNGVHRAPLLNGGSHGSSGSVEVRIDGNDAADILKIAPRAASRKRRPSPARRGRRVMAPWTDEEHDRLRALWPTRSAAAIAAELGRPVLGVQGKALRLGLRRPSRAQTKAGGSGNAGHVSRSGGGPEAAEDPDPAGPDDLAVELSGDPIAHLPDAAEECGRAAGAPDAAGDGVR